MTEASSISLEDLSASQWVIGFLGAFLIGLGKGGISGVGNFTIALYALSFPARASVGLLLPVLMIADIFAIILYRRTVAWRTLWLLLPWSVLGILLGAAFLVRADDSSVRLVIGITILVMSSVYFIRRILQRSGRDALPARSWPNRLFMAFTGSAGGFASMVANAAGPVAALYLLAAGLKKYAFIGTMAWLFFIINIIKFPFQSSLGMITLPSLQVSAVFAGAAIAGVFIARWIVGFIPQRGFEAMIWILIVVAGVRLVF